MRAKKYRTRFLVSEIASNLILTHDSHTHTLRILIATSLHALFRFGSTVSLIEIDLCVRARERLDKT